MAVFSTNQARHLYVANAVTRTSALATTPINNASAVGTIAVNKDKDGSIYFQYKGADNVMRSDLIDVKNILYVKSTSASKMARELKSFTVTLDGDINGGAPVAGQDYILRIAFKNYIGMSDADQYFKYGMVHINSKIKSASDVYKHLALSLAKNFSREVSPLLKFTLEISGEGTPLVVDASMKEEDLTGTYSALVIDEVEQDWVLGTMPQTPVDFEVQPVPILVEGDELIWGKVDDTEPEAVINNGKTIADLEYFCMGERGDVYRNVGFPNVIQTKLLVDPSKAYHTLGIHYAYVGSNEAVQKSEKTITIVSDNATALNNLIADVKTATGLTIDNVA